LHPQGSATERAALEKDAWVEARRDRRRPSEPAVALVGFRGGEFRIR
jgi:hypothetical protein